MKGSLMKFGNNVRIPPVGKPEGMNHLEDQHVGGRMGSKWILLQLLGGCGVDSPGSG
jgi:hypothetical protein